MSFFGSFWGTCCGTAVFERLRKVFFLKAFFHLLLMLFFCALFIGVCQYLMQSKNWRGAEKNFGRQFGAEINYSNGVWQPTLNPDQSSHLQLPFSTLLLYSSPQGLKMPEPEYLAHNQNIILWSHGSFVIARREREDQWSFFQIHPDDDPFKMAAKSELLSAADVGRKIEDASKLPAKKWPEGNQKAMSVHSIFKMVCISIAAGQAIKYILLYLSTLIFDLLLFSVAYMLFHWGANKSFTFAELWKIGIYAAFPGHGCGIFAACVAAAAGKIQSANLYVCLAALLFGDIAFSEKKIPSKFTSRRRS